MTDRQAPRNARQQDQVDRQLEPSDSQDSANVHPAKMGVDPAKLFTQAMEQTRMAICVTDPHQAGNPIVYVNQAFAMMTGYSRDESVGRNCKFLQGPDTDPEAVRLIRAALESQVVSVIEIKNYRKDGKPFWNSLHLGPIYDDDGKLTHFYGSQWDVTDLREERERSRMRREVAKELEHRTTNLFAVLGAIVRLSRRDTDDVGELVSKISSRIEALARAHKASLSVDDGNAIEIGRLAGIIMEPYELDRIEFHGPAIKLPEQSVTPLGLALHELATNAMKYGSLGHDDGRLDVSWNRHGDTLVIEWSETGASALPTDALERGGTGVSMIEGMLRSANGSIERDWRAEGLRAELRLPL